MFTAAASSIRVKLYDGDSDEDSVSWPFVRARPILTTCRQDIPQPSGSSTPLDRTSTGIISNQPQKVGLSALTTPAASKVTGLSVMALAKRESARRGLYSRFFRGPVLGPEVEESQIPEVAQRSSLLQSKLSGPKCNVSIPEKKGGKKRKSLEGDEETVVAQKKRESKRETRHKEKRRLKKNTETAEDRGDIVDHSRKKDRKKRKRNERQSTVRHEG